MENKKTQKGFKEIPFTKKSKEKIPYVSRIPDAPITEFLFSDTRVSWVWLAARLYIGYEWVVAGWEKAINPVWFGSKAGVAITGFVNNALTKTAGAHPDVQGWYAYFLKNFVLPNADIFSYLIVIGELAVGIALILGIFVGASALVGTFMNANFLLAGTVSTNPIFIFFQILLILAYRTAGWYGFDRYILKHLGMPWAPGTIFIKDRD